MSVVALPGLESPRGVWRTPRTLVSSHGDKPGESPRAKSREATPRGMVASWPASNGPHKSSSQHPVSLLHDFPFQVRNHGTSTRRARPVTLHVSEGTPAPLETDDPAEAVVLKPLLYKELRSILDNGFRSISHMKDASVTHLRSLKVNLCTQVLHMLASHFRQYGPLLQKIIEVFDDDSVVNHLEFDLNAARAEGDSLHAEIAMLKEEALNSASRHAELVKGLEKEVEKARETNFADQYVRLEQQLFFTNAQLDRLKEETTSQDSQIRDLEYNAKIYKEIEETFNALKAHNTALQHKTKVLEDVNDKWLAWKEQMLMKHDAEKGEWQEKERTLIEQARDANTRLLEAEENILAANREIAHLKTIKEKLEAKISELKVVEQSIKAENRAMTPRPNLQWFDDIADFPPEVKVQSVSGTTSGTVFAIMKTVQNLVQHNANLKFERDDALKLLDQNLKNVQLPGTSSHSANEGPSRSRSFVGLGMGPHVPAHLQASGRVRNRMLVRRDVDAVAREIWAFCGRGKGRKDLDQGLYHYFKVKHGVPQVVSEWGYSFQDSIHFLKDDPNCGFVYKVLHNIIPHDSWNAGEDLLAGLKTWVAAAEALDDSPRGKVLKRKFIAQLPKTFPMFTDEEMKQLKGSIDQEGSGNYLDAQTIFELPNAQQSTFVSKFRELYQDHILEYIIEMKQAVLSIAGGKSTKSVSLESILNSLMEVDPEKSIDLVVQFVTKCAAKMRGLDDDSEVTLSEGELLHVNQLVATFHVVFTPRVARKVLPPSATPTSVDTPRTGSLVTDGKKRPKR